jgi:hypothetical protein
MGIDYFGFCREMIKNQHTPLFEWCSRSNAVLLDYPEDQLTLIAIRNIITGEYVDYQKMIIYASKYKIPTVTCWPGSMTGNFRKAVN